MSASQNHGFLFEQMIFNCINRKDVLNINKSATSEWDIPAYQDPWGQGMPSSIKTLSSRGHAINMGSAMRIADLRPHDGVQNNKMPPNSWRIILGHYRQKNKHKEFFEIIVFTLTKENMEDLWGAMPFSVIEAFHHKIQDKTLNKHQARDVAKKEKSAIKNLYPDCAFQLHPKIDDSQRRIQCSLDMRILCSMLPKEQIKVYSNTESAHLPGYDFNQVFENKLSFPFLIESESRKRK